MGSYSDCYCWEIMQCAKSKDCPAKQNPEKNCWEIACEKDDDYRSFFNICRDCIVHVLKTENSVLTVREIKDIAAVHKKACRLSPPNKLIIT